MEVRLENLTKVFPGKGKGKKAAPDVYAVNDVNLTIEDGKLLGLLGPSGCGKSTTLYLIAGLHKPTAGKVFFGETDMTNVPPENRGIGLVFQNYALYPHLTVRQNIGFPLDNVRPKLDKREKEEVIRQVAALVNIDMLLDRKPKELSGGQQQRVAIARALSKHPKVLLLDEPLSNLDARLRLQTREEIKRIQREANVTTVFVTHDQEEAMSISDTIVVMDHGIIQQVGHPQEVYDEPINLFVAKFLGSPAINIFDGELINGVLFIDGREYDRGDIYQSKGEFSLLDEEIFSFVVDHGFSELEEDYYAMLEGRATVAVTSTTTEGAQEVSTPTIIPFELTRENLFYYVSEHGYSGKYEDFELALNKIRAKRKTNRPVKVGIRPEAFSFTERENKGTIPLSIQFIEHKGRDISIIANIHGQPDSKVRAIVQSEERGHVEGKDTIDMYAKRFYVFEDSGERIK